MPNVPAGRLGKILFTIVAIGMVLYLNADEEGRLMDALFASKPGRAVLAVVMTAIVLFSLYRGRTVDEFEIDAEESPNSFGCAVITEAVVAVGLWISLLF